MTQDSYYIDLRVAEAYDAEQAEREITTDDIPFYVGLAKEAAAAGQSVLELACGTGRVTIPIAEAGASVVGLDRSPAMLAVARRKSQGIANVRWAEGDMADFALGDRFGLIVIPFRSFLLLTTVAEQKSCLRSSHEHLADGGRLALTIFNPDIAYIAARQGEKRGLWTKSAPAADRELWATREYRTATQELNETRAEVQLSDDGAIISRVHRDLGLRYVFRYEMEHLLALSGFEVEALYGWFDGRPFDETSTEMVWLARKRSSGS